MQESIFMTFISAGLILSGFNPITLIVGLLSLIWWVSRFKRDIQMYHKGSIIAWIKWFIKRK